MTMISGPNTRLAGTRALRTALSSALLAASLLGSPALQAQPTASPAAPVQKLATITTLSAGMYNIKAEVAQTPQEHQIGLMSRTSMGANEGMIFVFPRAVQQCFWMKNTLIPLSIAFLEDDGTVVNLDEMQANTESPHCSAKPVRYVLEMNKGWFNKHSVKPGDKIRGPLFSPAR
ncbi:MAG: DUF192 domain-containing protein [Rubrivivax sp.]|nr:MAG: DUF192 domain-containing protein [Rubrivivax sp.]